MNITPDQNVFMKFGFFTLSETILTTWVVILLIFLLLQWSMKHKRACSFIEIIVLKISDQLEDIGLVPAKKYIGLLGSLFLFISFSAFCSIIPGYTPPTSALSTTVALATVVFISVLYFGISDRGIKGYFKAYLEPNPFMMPITVISEISRTIALAVRLFGNMMSGTMVVAILLAVMPFFVPVIMTLFGLVIGFIQAYIFTVLAAVYIAAGIQVRNR